MASELTERRLMFDWAGPGTCINCGFLAFSYSADLNEGREISLRRRAYPHGEDPEGRPDPLPGWWYCFVYAANLRGEMGQLEQEGVPGHERQAQIIAKGRECREFYAWVPGLDPLWHFQDREVQRLEELRRANDLKIAELDQRSQESMRQIMEAHKAIAEATRRDYRRSDRQTFRLSIAFVILAIVALVLALAPLAYPNGIGWLEDVAPGGIERPFESTPMPMSTPDTATPHPLRAT